MKLDTIPPRHQPAKGPAGHAHLLRFQPPHDGQSLFHLGQHIVRAVADPGGQVALRRRVCVTGGRIQGLVRFGSHGRRRRVEHGFEGLRLDVHLVRPLGYQQTRRRKSLLLQLAHERRDLLSDLRP